MSSLFKRGNIWWTWVRDPNGVSVRRSTKETDEVAAREKVLSWQRKAAGMSASQLSWTNHREGRTSVYFVQAGVDGPIKIGVAVNIKARLENMQTGNHALLVLLGEIAEGGIPEEQRWHTEFAQYRIRGEWFWPAAELVKAICDSIVLTQQGRLLARKAA